MGSELFRKLALGLPDVEEKAHFGKADFRVQNKIFAGFNDKGMAYVKLLPEQQDILCSAEPKVIHAHAGHWGKQGWTFIDQTIADESLLRSALNMAWRNVAPKRLLTSPE
ncbi:MAG: MmcQ/YjbR family DNA-binding protein [Pseudomonadota bacterium]|nr:MmcQ/YjbR family DNA-binding protein [Pseudomonadota bacterium]